MNTRSSVCWPPQKALWAVRDSFRGTVKCVFQPAEEYFPSGALAMMSKGDLDDCDAVIGIHVFSHIPAGKICVQPGGLMAASASVNIRVKGKGGHGGMPSQSVDAIVVASAIIMNLQPMVSRELDYNDPAVVSIGTLEAGTAKNIVAEEAYMTGTLRYFNNDLIGKLEDSIRRIATHTARRVPRRGGGGNCTRLARCGERQGALPHGREGGGAAVWGGLPGYRGPERRLR